MTLPPLDSEALHEAEVQAFRALTFTAAPDAVRTPLEMHGVLLNVVDAAIRAYLGALPRSPLPELHQKCPVCDGTGLVSRPHGIAGDVTTWMASSTAAFMCRRCEGVGTIPVGSPALHNKEQKP